MILSIIHLTQMELIEKDNIIVRNKFEIISKQNSGKKLVIMIS